MSSIQQKPQLKVIKRNETPPGGWRYVQAETGQTFEHYVIDALEDEVKQHRKANNIPIGLNFYQEIEQQNAERLISIAPEWVEGGDPAGGLLVGMANAAVAFAKWAAAGFKCVTPDQLAERQSICGSCDKWNGSRMWGYGACDACGCSSLKLFLTTEKCPIGKWKAL